MKLLTIAVLVCIALITVGCNSPDFRGSRWGDSREQVKTNEFNVQQSSESRNDWGLPQFDSNKALFYNGSAELKGRSYYVTVRYRFDKNERLRSAAYEFPRPGLDYNSHLIKTLLKQYGKPTHYGRHVGSRLEYEKLADGENPLLEFFNPIAGKIIRETYISWETPRSWITFTYITSKVSYYTGNSQIGALPHDAFEGPGKYYSHTQLLYRPISEFKTRVHADWDWQAK